MEKTNDTLTTLSRCSFVVLLIAAFGLTGCSGCDGDADGTRDTGADTGAPVETDATGGTDATDETPVPDTGRSDAELEKKRAVETDKSATLSEKPPLEIEGLLTVEDVAKLAGDSSFATADLVGQKPSPSYNAVRFEPQKDGDYGAGLQVWSFSDKKSAAKRFDELKHQYLAVSSPPDDLETPGARAFLSDRGGILQLVSQLDEPPAILAVSCSPNLCDSPSKAAQLLRTAADRYGTD